MEHEEIGKVNAISRFEITELATQLICSLFEASLEASAKVDALDASLRTSVYLAARPIAEAKLHDARESGVPKRIVQALECVADVAQKLGDHATALSMLDECIDLEKEQACSSPFTFSN